MNPHPAFRPAEKLVLRSQLSVDASLRLKNALRQIALAEEVTLKFLVLRSIAVAYPDLEGIIRDELKREL